MKSSRFLTLLLAAVFGVFACAAAETTATAAAPKSTAKAKKNKKKKAPRLTLEEAMKQTTTPLQNPRHVKRHKAKLAFAKAKKNSIKILMLGDSITHGWEGKLALEARKKYLDPYNVINLGCGGDRTQHTLWIIEKSGILEEINPKLVTIMIGTNNQGYYQATVAGIKKILESVRKRYPKAQILLYAIFPRGKDNKNRLRITNDKVNAEIVKFCNGKDILWVDIRKDYLTPEGILEKSMMPDLLHPRTSKGYDVWGKSLLPYFKKYGK